MDDLAALSEFLDELDHRVKTLSGGSAQDDGNAGDRAGPDLSAPPLEAQAPQPPFTDPVLARLWHAMNDDGRARYDIGTNHSLQGPLGAEYRCTT